ncbi:MAG: MFS transporter [Candidatus Magasanikbacteria bacterium]|nr:MFS transporter [Candidatus Magasanikbacteria bacterium]
MLNPKLKILLWGSNVWSLGEGMLGPLFAVFAGRVGGNLLEMSWAWATYLMVTGVFTIIVGKVADKKIKKTRLLIFGNALNALFTFGYLLVDGPLQLFAIQVGLGLASALVIPAWDALYSEFEDKKHDEFEWGLASGEAEILAGVAIIIGGLIVNYFSFSLLFITMGTLKVLATICYARILRVSKA